MGHTSNFFRPLHVSNCGKEIWLFIHLSSSYNQFTSPAGTLFNFMDIPYALWKENCVVVFGMYITRISSHHYLSLWNTVCRNVLLWLYRKGLMKFTNLKNFTQLFLSEGKKTYWYSLVHGLLMVQKFFISLIVEIM